MILRGQRRLLGTERRAVVRGMDSRAQVCPCHWPSLKKSGQSEDLLLQGIALSKCESAERQELLLPVNSLCCLVPFPVSQNWWRNWFLSCR